MPIVEFEFKMIHRGMYYSETNPEDNTVLSLNPKRVLQWYEHNFPNIAPAGVEILSMRATASGIIVRCAKNVSDTRKRDLLIELRSDAEMIADPDDDANYPIGTFSKGRFRYGAAVSSVPNVLAVGKVRSFKIDVFGSSKSKRTHKTNVRS